MATHHESQDERRDDYPRNLEREPRRDARQTPHPQDHRETAGHDGPDGEVVRSEPAAARASDPDPERHEQPGGRDGNGAGRSHSHSHTSDASSVHDHPGEGERLIRAAESDDLRRRWESIQASFIDSPRESVEEADRLVGELTDRIAERFRSERSGLDAYWERGDEASTEDLRLTLQRYRGFFDRLLQL